MFPLTEEFRTSRLTPPRGRINHIVLDTDTFNEEDDQFALAYAAKAHAKGETVLEAVYAAPFSHPGVRDPGEGMELSFGEIHHILAMIGMDGGEIPVFRGPTRYMHGKRLNWDDIPKGKPQRLVEPDGTPAGGVTATPVESDAARDLIDRAMARSIDDPLYVCVIGCPTNVASALLFEPRIAEKIVVIFLGGHALDWPDCLEYNIRQDLPASRVLFDSGVPMLLMPAYNIVRGLTTTVWELEHFLKGKSEIGTYLCDLVRRKTNWQPSHVPADEPYAASKVVWDIAAIAAVVKPQYMETKLVPAPRPTDDLRWDEPDPSRHTIRILRNIYRDDVFSDLFYHLNG